MDQLQGHLTFTDTAFTGDQYTFTVNVYQHAVDADARCQFHLQPAGTLCRKRGSIFVTAQDRDSHFFRCFFVLFCYRKIPAEYNTWHFIGHDLSQHLGTFLYTDLFHISIFHLSDDLDTMVVKIIKKICQLQGRTVGVRLGDLYIFNVYFRCQIDYLHLLDKFIQRNCIHT